MTSMRESLFTGRLTLAALTVDDAADLHVVVSDVGHTIGDGPVTDPEATLHWLARRERVRADIGLTWYGVRIQGSRELIGTAGLFRGRTGEDPEIGFEISTQHRGYHYASESVGGVLAEADRVGLTVWATVRVWNESSLSVLRKHDFQRVRVESDERGPLIYLKRTLGKP